MVEQDTIYTEKVKYVGIFDLKDVYNFIYTWFDDHNYLVEERKYAEKIKPNGKEIEIEWTAIREISDYFRFCIKARWLIVGLTNVEIEKQGKKIKMNRGDIEIKFTGILEKDYRHSWEHSAFAKFLRDVYDRYIIRGRIEQYEDKIAEETIEVVEQVKAYFALTGRR